MKILLATDDSEISDAAVGEGARLYHEWVDLFEQTGPTTIHCDVSATSNRVERIVVAATGARP